MKTLSLIICFLTVPPLISITLYKTYKDNAYKKECAVACKNIGSVYYSNHDLRQCICVKATEWVEVK